MSVQAADFQRSHASIMEVPVLVFHTKVDITACLSSHIGSHDTPTPKRSTGIHGFLMQYYISLSYLYNYQLLWRLSFPIDKVVPLLVSNNHFFSLALNCISEGFIFTVNITGAIDFRTEVFQDRFFQSSAFLTKKF